MDAGTEKNNPSWLNPHVLTDFIDDLRDAGYKIGISQYIAAEDLILALTARGETLNRPERLKTLLGPIFCSSPAEQEDFQQRFDRWVEFVSQTGRATERADVKAQALSEELGKIRWRLRQLIPTLVAIILTGIFLPILWEESIKDDSSRPTTPSVTQPNPDFPLDWLISLFFFLLPLFIAFLVWWLWWLRRAHLFLQRHGTTEQPELHKISIRDFEQNLFPTIMFIHTAQSLRHRIRIPSHELDVDKTIDATFRQGGWLTPVYGTRQVLPEYLFLINRASYRDHQARFMEEMVDLLRHNGVFITSYFFDDDPRICFPSDTTSSPRKLREITAKYTQHRLVIVSDTEKLFSTQTGELEPWVSQMTTWGNRAILTPKPVENWGYQELELARQFIVLPATPKGVRVLSQVLHQGSATYVLSEKAQIPLPEPLCVRPHYWIERNPPTPEQINAMLNSLQEYLGKDGFYWLSACAVFPELQWNITIYLGNVLKTAEGDCLLEVCSLTNLARLPWFRYGDMPDWLRSLLIATLTHEQKHTIRTALQDLLVTAVQGSVGKLQLEVAKKHHSFLPKLANAILHLLSRRVTEGSPLRDYLFLSFMRGQPKLAIEVPDTFSRLLQKQKRLQLIAAGVGVILLRAGVLFMSFWKSPTPAGSEMSNSAATPARTHLYQGFLKQVNNSAVSDSEPTQYVLSPNKTIVIGRDPSHCDIVLDSNHYPDISRQHLKISPLSSQSPGDMPVWEICDLGSTNGTYVNGQRLQGCQTLQPHDHIKISNKGSEFIFVCEEDNTLSLTDIFPLTSNKLDLHQKGYLLPGIITVLTVVAILATREYQKSLAYILAAYLVTASHYIIHKICHKHKPWWLLLSVALATGLPVLTGYFQHTSSEHSIPAMITSSFQVGLLQELFKALPVLLVYVLGRLLQSHSRELIGVWEPLDGILLGTACATAFALAETYLLLNDKKDSDILTFLIPRILGEISGEVAYSGCFGYFIGLSALKPSKRWQLLGIGYLISALMHTLWEMVLDLLKNGYLLPLVGNPLLALVGSLAYVFLMAAIVKANQLSPNHS